MGGDGGFPDEGSAEVADAELALLLADTQSQDLENDAPSLALYGFTDFTLMSTSARNPNGDELGFFPEFPTFAIGNVNLYMDANLTNGWRSLTEVRFLYLPNGGMDFSVPTRISTAVPDYAKRNRPLNWGGIEIERAWLQYTALSFLTVRVGQWLTPYGIWNVDHGTPTIIPILQPYPIGEAFFPERQTGIQVFGSFLLGSATVGYHFTVSNGRGPADAIHDLDSNKALGGRLYLKTTAVGVLTLGVSGYVGRATDSQLAFDFSTGFPRFEEQIVYQYDELSYAADLLWQWGGLHVQIEALANEVVYTDRGRPHPELVPNPAVTVPDHWRHGVYGLVGYRLPWFGIMPYGYLEYQNNGKHVSAPGVTVSSGYNYAIDVGINMRPTPMVTLKIEREWAFLHELEQNILDRIDVTAVQVAWAF